MSQNQIGIDPPFGSSIWSISQAFEQQEMPDQAMDTSPPASGGMAYTIGIMQSVSTLIAGLAALVPPIAVGSNIFAFMMTLATLSVSAGDQIEGSSDDEELKVYITNLNSSLNGIQANARLLQAINPLTSPATYRADLIAFNAVLLAGLPQFQQTEFRRQATPLFIAAATIHLTVLSQLALTSTTDAKTWSIQLWNTASSYAAWLAGSKVAILEAREADIRPLYATNFAPDVFHDLRLVQGATFTIDASPGLTAPATRRDYITRRMSIFARSDWMQDIDNIIAGWLRTSKLCSHTDRNIFAPIPQGAVFPGIGDGGSYIDLAEKITWSNANTINLLPTASTAWVALAVPSATEGVATIDVTTTNGVTRFSVNSDSGISIGPYVQSSQVYCASLPNCGMVLGDPIRSNATLAAFNIMLSNEGGDPPASPLAIVLDKKIGPGIADTYTVRRTSALIGFNPGSYDLQTLALETPLPVQPGQLVGFYNPGNSKIFVTWSDIGPSNVLWVQGLGAQGSSAALSNTYNGVPVSNCGWNFTAYPDAPL